MAAVVLLPACHPGSGVVSSSSGADCDGYFTNRHNPYQFGLKDKRGGDDDDFCYIDYGPSSGNLPRRVSIPEDLMINSWQYRNADLGGISERVWFKVCEERQNDDDYCSGAKEASI